MAHQVETMAYAGEVPWHGLGVQVEDDLTPAEMLKKAKLDWTVSKRAMYTTNKSGKDAKIQVPSHAVLVRDSDNKPLGPVGPKFIPTQNSEAFEFFDKFASAGKIKMETAGSLRQGRQIWGLAKMQEGFTVAGKDRVEGYMLVAVSHEWGRANEIRFTPIRVVCNNTLTMALTRGSNSGVFKMPHVKAFDSEIIRSAEEALGLANDKLAEYEERSKFLASKQYKEDDVVRYIAELFQPELVKQEEIIENSKNVSKIITSLEIKDEFKKVPSLVYQALEQGAGANLKSAKGTWWGAYNAVTFVTDHKWGRDRESALNNAWFGWRANLKNKALQKATEYANVA
jgi:phage/plasmid-like protein (TIGR03299 family)